MLAHVQAAARDRFGLDLSGGASSSAAEGCGALPAGASLAGASTSSGGGLPTAASSPPAAAAGETLLLPLSLGFEALLCPIASHLRDEVKAIETQINAALTLLPDAESGSALKHAGALAAANVGAEPSRRRKTMFSVRYS